MNKRCKEVNQLNMHNILVSKICQEPKGIGQRERCLSCLWPTWFQSLAPNMVSQILLRAIPEHRPWSKYSWVCLTPYQKKKKDLSDEVMKSFFPVSLTTAYCESHNSKCQFILFSLYLLVYGVSYLIPLFLIYKMIILTVANPFGSLYFIYM